MGNGQSVLRWRSLGWVRGVLGMVLVAACFGVSELCGGGWGVTLDYVKNWGGQGKVSELLLYE